MTDTDTSPALPVGWTTTTIGSLTDVVASRDPREEPDRNFNYVDISSIDNERLVVAETKPLRGAEAPSRARRPLEAGDVLFSNVRTYLRNVARVDDVPQPAVASTGFTVLRPNGAVVTDYLFRYVSSDEFLALVTPRQTGTHYPATSEKVVREQVIPLPPLLEQRRIAKRLEYIDARRAAAATRLGTARAAVEQFRTAALAAAYSGRLTDEWREEHPRVGADELLATAVERRRAQGKDFTEPVVNPHASAHPLPDSWRLVPLGLLLEDLKYGTSKRSGYHLRGTPVLRIPNVSTGVLDVEDLKFADLDDREKQALRLRLGDLLMIRSNGSVQLVGRTAAVTREGEGMAYAGYLLRLRADGALLDPEFLRLMLASPQIRHQIELPARSTSGVHNINAREVRSLGVPIPSLDEQAEIVRRLQFALASAGRLDSNIDRASRTLNQFARATLVRAFRGELVPTEADIAANEQRDFESADELLARVAGEESVTR